MVTEVLRAIDNSNLGRDKWYQNVLHEFMSFNSVLLSELNLLVRRVYTLDFDLMVLREIRRQRIRPRRSWERRVYTKTFGL